MESVNSHNGASAVQLGLTASVEGNRYDWPEKSGVERLFFSTRLNGQVEPEALLPSQYYDSVGRRNHLNGEFRLVAAILVDAVRCYINYAKPRSPEQRRMFEEVHHWFYSRNQRGLFAFETVCEMLGLEAHSVRNALNLPHATRIKLRRQSGRFAIGPLRSRRNGAHDTRRRNRRFD